MKATPPKTPDSDPMKPVAYDQYGRPLYAHPPAASQTQVVHMSRAIEPETQVLSEETKRKHAESRRLYPQLNISEGEFVISAVKRHPIGLFSIWAVVGLALVIVIIGLPALIANQSVLGAGFQMSAGMITSVGFILLLLAILFVLGGIIATVVYQGNRFYLTNESVMQHIQTSLFTRMEQTVSLVNIEDASYRQHGIVQMLLNYGSLRLSTEGDETTYRFNFVANPQRQITLLNDAIEAFKNFRPVGSDEN